MDEGGGGNQAWDQRHEFSEDPVQDLATDVA